MQHVFDYGAERRGVTLTCRALKDTIQMIEMERNGARRYKLLKQVIKNTLEDPDYLLKHKETKPFIYKFEKGQLTTKEIKEDEE